MKATHYQVLSRLEVGGKIFSRGIVFATELFGDANLEELVEQKLIVPYDIGSNAALAGETPEQKVITLEAEVARLQGVVAEKEARIAELEKQLEPPTETPVIKIKGIGKEIAQVLIDKGWSTVESLCMVCDEDLIAIPGIDDKVLAAIRKVAPFKTE